MNKTIFTLVAIAVIVFSTNSFADTITTPEYLGTSQANVGNWGTAYSAVKLTEYTAGNNKTKTGLWKQRFDALTGYLSNTLGSNQMTTTDDSATSASKNNYGLLSTKSHEVEYHSASDGGMGSIDLNSIYGRRADAYAQNSTQAQSGYNQLIREGSNASVMAYDSSAAADSGYESESASAHTWNYNATTDTWAGSSSSSKTTLDDHGMGIYAFVTGFVYDPATTLDYLNGWFSVLGNLEDVLLNGQSLLASDDYYWMSEDVHDSKWFASYDFELNLDKLFADELLKTGNNNIAFVVDSYPAEILLGIPDFTDNNDSLIGFAADVWKTDTSILPGGGGGPEPPGPPAVVPEPATILIFGLGLAGLGLRRRFTKKG